MFLKSLSNFKLKESVHGHKVHGATGGLLATRGGLTRGLWARRLQCRKICVPNKMFSGLSAIKWKYEYKYKACNYLFIFMLALLTEYFCDFAVQLLLAARLQLQAPPISGPKERHKGCPKGKVPKLSCCFQCLGLGG